MAADLKGKVLTALGPVPPNELGVVLPHEHLFLDFLKGQQPCNYLNESIKDLHLTLGNMGRIRQYPYSVHGNIQLDCEEDIIDELRQYRKNGGGTICDLTVRGIRNKPNQLKVVSEATGVNIVCGTGFYVDMFLSDEERNMSIEAMAEVMIDEIAAGIPGTDGVRCGIIGEIGCSWPLTVTERRVLQAAAQAQQQTGAPLIIHPGRDSSAPFEIVDVLRGAGADLSRTVMSHLDRTLHKHEEFLRFAETGCISELDLFGIECSHYQPNLSVDMPSDAQRISAIKMLCDKGYSDKVFISHDIHSKHRLVKYGGHGFSHILENIIPKMKDRGIPEDSIKKITFVNPKNWLTFI